MKYEILKEINETLSWLYDEESRRVFLQRVLFRITNDMDYIYQIASKSNFFEIDNAYQSYIDMQNKYAIYPQMDVLAFLSKNEYRNKEISIFGAGEKGKALYKFLSVFGVKIHNICDSNKCGSMFFGKEIISPECLRDLYNESLILISSNIYAQEIFLELKKMGIPEENIFIPEENANISFYGLQYFEPNFFEPEDGEVYVDAGAYALETVCDFIQWCPNYKKIYSFEPDLTNYEMCRKKIEVENLKNVELFHLGLWSQKKELCFERCGDNGTGSTVREDGKEIIKVDSLDNILQGGKVTFIKMDIEGSELEALKGASDTIKKYRPKLAICLYHKPNDIFEIPRYIKELVPEYKMGIRHYCTFVYDTILYCWI